MWPKSRKSHPKPFHKLLGNKTLFQQTLERNSDPDIYANPLIVAGSAHVELIKAQTRDLAPGSLIVEPSARNTAPAIALAAARLDPDQIMLVCPSDHFIADRAAFENAVRAAANLAAKDWLVSLAITPDRPEVGYGYIKRGEKLEAGFKVERFVEKPELETAIAFLADGGYSWNGGIFAFRAGAMIDELARYRPEMAQHVTEAVESGTVEGVHFNPDAEAFNRISGESIDYAVMENTSRAAMVPATMGWSDIGNWAGLQDVVEKDASKNHSVGSTDLIDCEHVLVRTDGPRVSALGLKDVCIVVDGDEVLVTSREGASHVGKLKGARDQ